MSDSPVVLSPARKPGRPRKRRGPATKRTETTRARLLEAARAGYSSNEAICRAAGISTDTLARWSDEDATLMLEIQAAREERLDRIESGVLAAAEQDPRIGLQVLRSRRSGYDARARVELTGKDGGAIQHELLAQLPAMSDDQLSAAIKALEDAVNGTVLGAAVKTRRKAAKAAEEEGAE